MRALKAALSGARASVGAVLVGMVLAVSATPAQAQLTGTVDVPSGTYATLEAALLDLNAQGVGAGGVTINLLSGNPQTAPAGGYVVNLAASNATAANPITLRGNGNTITASAGHAAGDLNDAIFKIIGEDHVTIENFVMQENPANTTTAVATNNMTEWGVALLYRTTTDNAQNVTIRNNQITLNRTYQNTFGIYANATHTATAPTTGATATGPGGGNSGLRILNNTISNVNNGITVVGPTAADDHNTTVEIGTSGATGNTITNYGTTGTFSGYVNVSGTVNGILVRNTRNYTIAHNTITSSNGGTTAGTLRGIFIPAFSSAPTGTLTQEIRQNTISLRSGVTAGAILGVAVDATTANLTTTLAISNNDFVDSGHTTPTASGTINFIQNGAANGTMSVSNNTFTNLSVNTTGGVSFIIRGNNMPAGASETVSNNRIVGSFAKTGAGGTVAGFSANGSSVNGSSMVNRDNNFSNVTLTGATVFVGIGNTEGAGSTNAPTKLITDNIIRNITGGSSAVTGISANFGAATTVQGNTIENLTGTGAITGISHGASNGQGTHNYLDNVITGLVSTGAGGAVAGISGGSSAVPTLNVAGNRISGLSTTGTGAVSGIVVSAAAIQNVQRNRIFDLVNSNAGGFVNGILVSAGTTVNLQNNLVGDLRTPAANAANPLVGINITGGTNVLADYNTVNLNATSTGALFGSSALSASTTPTLTLRNNNLVNTSTANTTGFSVAYRRSTTTLTSYAATSNANNLFAPSLYFDGTNNDTTLAAYKARVVPRDAAAVSENPAWQSTVGTNPNFLNISTTVATQLESGGIPVTGITTDVAGNTRNVTTPDIGAWEFNGVLLDLTPPAIAFAPLANTTATANRTLAATITDVSGIAGGANAPRVYFRKGTSGAYVSTACSGSAPNFTCTIDNAQIGGVAAGDTVNYFVVAQDTAGNVAANPSAGFAATDVNTVTSPPTTPAAYLVVAPFPAAVNVGTGEAYASLTNPGGLFEALNAGVLTGNVVATITTDLTAETGAVALNQVAEEGAGAGTYTVTIRPSGARTVSGAPGTGGRLIDLNGADRVAIDGLNAGGNSLLIRNEGIGEIVRFINDATSNSLLNAVLEGGAGVTAINVATGLVTGNDDILIANNIVRDRTVPTAGVPFNAIGATESSTTIINDRLVIRGNEIVNFTQGGIILFAGVSSAGVRDNLIRRTLPSTNALQAGIFSNGFQGGTNVISGNTIRDLESTATTASRLAGIEIFTATGGSVEVSGNRIENLRHTTTAAQPVFGIRSGVGAGGSTAATVIADNVIVGLTSATTGTGQLVGIDLATHTQGVVAERNLVSGLALTATSAAQMRGIQIGNTQPAATVSENRIFGFAPSATATGVITGIFFGGASGQPAAATLVNNYISIAPTATTGQQIFGIFDFAFANNTLRADFNSIFVGGTGSGSASTWAFRRGDLTPTSITLRNNMFYNARSGGTGRHYAVGDQSVNTGSWTSNRNLFVGTGTTAGQHFDLGTAGAGTPVDFTAWQAGPPTRDANSTSFEAGAITLANYFVDAPAGNLDLLSTAVGAVNAGFTIAGIPTDINGTLRLDPPEIGAFELPERILSISPLPVDFGDVAVGATSPDATVTFANTGNASLDVTALTAAAAPFALSGGTCPALPITLAPGASCTLTYTFAPTAAGPAAQTLSVTSNATVTGPITLQGNGVQGNLTITPGSVNFGNVNVGTPGAEETVTLANTGDASLDVTALTAAAAPFARTATGTCSATLPITIAAGGSCTLTYTFTPAAAGAANQVLTVTANAPGSGTISLAGNGVAGEFSVTPNPVAFGNQLVGTTSAPLTATLSNTGAGSLTVSALPDPSAPFARSGGTCGATPFSLAGGGSCTVEYTFAPTAAGAASGTVAIVTSVGPVNLSLTGTGTQGILVIAPTTAAFGDVAVGGTSAAQTVTLSNSGTAVLDVTALTAAAAPFTRTGGTCAATPPITIAAGGSCTLTYTFSPTATGAASQTLTVTANAPGSGTITLTGTGTPSADLSIVKTSAVNLIGLGLIQYNLVVANAGPNAVTSAVVADTFPAGLTNILWSCVGIGGGACAANGTGNINQLVDLPNGATVVFSITANVPLPLPNSIANTATVTAPTGVTDPVPGNNTSTVNDVILIFADGFESATMATISLPETDRGEFRSTVVSASAIATAATGLLPADAARYEVAGATVVVQARRIGDAVEVRVLTVDAAGEWTVGSWAPTAGAPVALQWNTGVAAGGRTPVSARLRIGN
jgi:hypothetical protein